MKLEWAQLGDCVEAIRVGQESLCLQELLSKVLACRVWGRLWNGKEIVVYCGNMAAVGVVNSGYSQVKAVMHLLQSLFLFGPTSN